MLAHTHNLWGVLLSFVIAALASFVALDLSGRLRAPARSLALLWKLGGALVMGSGIWSMHFVGMLSLSLPITLGYGLAKTLLSWVAAVAVSGLALQIASRPRLRLHTLAGGALLMGAGICTMHYTGMSALEMAPGIVWNPWLVLATLALLGTAWLLAAQDVRLQAQAHRAEQAQQARQSADTANQAKTQFLARMSHELRTPLNAIHGFAELMLRDKGPSDPAAQRLRLELIIQSSRHLAALIDDLLDVSRIELGALDVQVVSTEVGHIVLAATQELADRARLGGVSVHGPAPGPALWAMADPVRMHQIASNLISNAIKYNHRDGRVEIQVALRDEWVCLSVEDGGDGMSASQLQSLFQPFNRLGRSAHTEGVGIGLVITQHLVANMGGRIEVRSTPGQGSCFTVLLRRGHPEAALADGGLRAPLPLAREDVHGSVLYIEDDEVNRILTQSYLQLRPGRAAAAGRQWRSGRGQRAGAAARPDAGGHVIARHPRPAAGRQAACGAGPRLPAAGGLLGQCHGRGHRHRHGQRLQRLPGETGVHPGDPGHGGPLSAAGRTAGGGTGAGLRRSGAGLARWRRLPGQTAWRELRGKAPGTA